MNANGIAYFAMRFKAFSQSLRSCKPFFGLELRWQAKSSILHFKIVLRALGRMAKQHREGLCLAERME